MNNITRLLYILAFVPALTTLQGCGQNETGGGHAETSGHAEDDGHGDHGSEAGDSHDDHGDHDDHGGHGDEEEHGDDVVQLTPAQLERAGVVIKPLAGGTIATHVTLPAEVGLNYDKVVHVTPRVPGVVTQVFGLLGQQLEEGELLAVLESPELGEAKIAYLQAIQEKAIADASLARERTVSKNTELLLDILRQEPTLDELLSKVSGLRIGENKGRLISAYARVNASRANYNRERGLREEGLSTESDLLAAQEAFNSSQAEYMAAFEDIDFTFHLRLQEAEQAAQVAASTVDNAERRLHIFGLSHEQVLGIANEPDTSVSRYELTAPGAGMIVSKHITPGEKVGTEEPVYTLADLDTVWLNVSVYTRYVDLIKEGLRVTVRAGGRETVGLVDYVSPVVSESTRTVSARVVINNSDGLWKPGEFVTARVETGRIQADRIVPMDAIQTYEGQEVIFIQDEDGIEPVAVRIGRRSDTAVELLGDDIALGTPIVVRNSFLIKAELGKGSAGHDH